MRQLETITEMRTFLQECLREITNARLAVASLHDAFVEAEAVLQRKLEELPQDA